MKNNLKVILNEQNELINGQKLLIISLLGENEYINHEFIKCPLTRWTRGEMDEVLQGFFDECFIDDDTQATPRIVFAVPIPYMVAKAVRMGAKVYLFVKNRKELDKGKVVNEYELVEI